jgi:hypothetical protein
VIVIVIVIVRRARARARVAQHRHDTHHERLALASEPSVDVAGNDAHVDQSSTLHRRTTSNPMKARTIGRAGLARALRDVQRDGHRRGLELRSQFALSARKSCNDAEGEAQKVE